MKTNEFYKSKWFMQQVSPFINRGPITRIRLSSKDAFGNRILTLCFRNDQFLSLPISWEDKYFDLSEIEKLEKPDD